MYNTTHSRTLRPSTAKQKAQDDFAAEIKANAMSEADVEKLAPGFVQAVTGEDIWDAYEKFTFPADKKAKKGSVLIVAYERDKMMTFVKATVTSKTENTFTGEPELRVKVGTYTFRPSGCYRYALVTKTSDIG
jgi:hypothetical protein